MKQKVATIVGSNGQDGKLIASLLEKKNYKIIKISKENFDITSRSSVENFIKTKKTQRNLLSSCLSSFS